MHRMASRDNVVDTGTVLNSFTPDVSLTLDWASNDLVLNRPGTTLPSTHR